MRTIININEKWLFDKGMKGNGEVVDLPHCYNGTDGQDGGNDYFRGKCSYSKKFRKAELPESDRYFLEVNGANSVSEVFLNGVFLSVHKGGYSTFRVDLTDHLSEENELVITVDNSHDEEVYPQNADFTFYGGLYRDVNIICVSETHFELEKEGHPGIHVKSTVKGKTAEINISSPTVGFRNTDKLEYRFYDEQGNLVVEGADPRLMIDNVHLWDGIKGPYLYKAEARIIRNGEIIDEVSTEFGCRSFRVDPEKGFFLNERSYPLHGVSRHQDRKDIGNALLKEHHKQDVELICEMGANSIRLAHYQHDQYFYDLCDKKGLVVWAEIPYISRHVHKANENAKSQMRELITQCYNHPSICFWGLSNEITMVKTEDKDVVEEHHRLNELVHEMDPTRLTTMANFAPLSIDNELVHLSDVTAYNLYFGWYSGNMNDYGPWFDRFHKKYPQRAIALSEYGAEALNWHSSKPEKGDYTEEYQALYHEKLIEQMFSRKYIWATYVWNMFDFGADARREGGENGQNHKGLVTIDRKYKKDSFYIYKAYLSDEPFVHICSKRCVDRCEMETVIKIYSNLDEVELFVNGTSIGKKTSSNHVFSFLIRNEGVSEIRAVSGKCEDNSVIRKTEKMNQDYVLKERWDILNWNEITEVKGHFSLNDTVGELLSKPAGILWLVKLLGKVLVKSVKKEKTGEKEDTGIITFRKNMSVLNYVGLFRKLGISFNRDELISLNESLNKINKK